MYLSPCLIAVIVIIIYIFMGKQNQVKIKNFIINRNKKVFIGLLIFGIIYYFMNVEGMDHEDEHSDDAGADSDADADADAAVATEEPGTAQEPEGVSEKECLLYWPF